MWMENASRKNATAPNNTLRHKCSQLHQIRISAKTKILKREKKCFSSTKPTYWNVEQNFCHFPHFIDKKGKRKWREINFGMNAILIYRCLQLCTLLNVCWFLFTSYFVRESEESRKSLLSISNQMLLSLCNNGQNVSW